MVKVGPFLKADVYAKTWEEKKVLAMWVFGESSLHVEGPSSSRDLRLGHNLEYSRHIKEVMELNQ